MYYSLAPCQQETMNNDDENGQVWISCVIFASKFTAVLLMTVYLQPPQLLRLFSIYSYVGKATVSIIQNQGAKH